MSFNFSTLDLLMPRFSALSRLGYDGCCEQLDASRWLPQRRRRVWFCFMLRGLGDPQKVFRIAEKCQPIQTPDLSTFLRGVRQVQAATPIRRRARPSNRKGRPLKWPRHTLLFIQQWRLRSQRLQACVAKLSQQPDFELLTLREQRLLGARYGVRDSRVTGSPSPGDYYSLQNLQLSKGFPTQIASKSTAPRCCKICAAPWLSKVSKTPRCLVGPHLAFQMQTHRKEVPRSARRGNAMCAPLMGAILLGALACDAASSQ